MLKQLLAEGLLHGDCLTVTGKTMAENLQGLPGLAEVGEPIGARPGRPSLVLSPQETGAVARDDTIDSSLI